MLELRLVLFSVLTCQFLLCSYVSGLTTYGGPDYACGGLLYASQGYIESPLFPDLYPPQVDCSWSIKAQPGSRIRVTSQYFSVEYQPECLWDYVAIEDGEEGEHGHELYCGSEGLEFVSTSNVVKLYFHTDISGSDLGFRLYYETLPPPGQADPGCNMTLTTEDNVTSPGYPYRYPPDSLCFYHIQAPVSNKIRLEFVTFHLESPPCDFDKLEVYDGDTLEKERILGTFCGSNRPVALTSNSNIMTLKFLSDENIEAGGFIATVSFIHQETSDSTIAPPASVEASTATSRAPTTTATTSNAFTGNTNTSEPGDEISATEKSLPTEDGCNQTISTTMTTVSSPGFPSPYPHNVLCITKLRSEVLSSFVLRFVNFSVEEGENCTYDSLSIIGEKKSNSSLQTSRNVLRQLCGHDLEDPIISWEGYGLDLVFRSDMSVSDGGYSAQVIVTPVNQGLLCPAVCENGGTCVETLLAEGSVDWMCNCPEGFTGALCENPVRPTCDTVLCENSGKCVDDGSEVTCVCPSGYSGPRCEVKETPTGGGTLYFTKMVGNMSLSPGGSVILECAVSDPSAHVMWLFQDRIMTNADWSNGVEVHPGGVVVIPEVRDEHSGRYTCMAITADDLVERSMWLHLTEPCALSVSKAPSNLTVREGQAAMFQCYIPDADVMLWRKDGDIIKQGPRRRVLVNHYLVISPVMETDIGQYTCSARAKNGCFAQVSAHLSVESTGHGNECGRARVHSSSNAHQTGSGRISSGRETTPGSAPWQVILREVKKDTTFCGGTLISPDTVLTAAHCVGQFEQIFGYPFHPRHIQIYLGTYHCAGHNGIYRQLASYVLHEHFNDSHYNNDVALFKLDRPVDYSDDVMPICLETPEFLTELLKPGKLGLVTGCGGRVAHGLVPTFMHEVQIPYVTRDICRERAAAVNTSFTDGMFCAGYARSMRGDACAGDSGGPLMVEFSGRAIQVGIVSWGVGCDRENHYGYYTNMAYYYDWIMDKLDKK